MSNKNIWYIHEIEYNSMLINNKMMESMANKHVNNTFWSQSSCVRISYFLSTPADLPLLLICLSSPFISFLSAYWAALVLLIGTWKKVVNNGVVIEPVATPLKKEFFPSPSTTVHKSLQKEEVSFTYPLPKTGC